MIGEKSKDKKQMESADTGRENSGRIFDRSEMESGKKDKKRAKMEAKTKDRMGSSGNLCLRMIGEKERIATKEWLFKRKRKSESSENDGSERSKKEREDECLREATK